MSTLSRSPSGSAYDVQRVRDDFPILSRRVGKHPLVYLDNAATTQKPQSVLDAINNYYTQHNSNVHRGVHRLSEEATQMYENARRTVQQFLGAASTNEIIFTRGTTEAINLVAQAYGRNQLHEGDEVLITEMEHHSNIVPWQILCQQTGAKLKVVPISDAGELFPRAYEKLLSHRTRIVSLVQVSNALGTVNPIKQMIELAHGVGAVVMIDGAQSAPHMPVDVASMDCDFFACSGHKLYGPTGIGVLYGKAALLHNMAPYQSGGDMIRSVSFEKTTYNELPYKFEAGTPNISGAIGMAAAVDYINSVGIAEMSAHESELLVYGTRLLGELPEIRMIGTAAQKAAVLSFVIEGVHAHDVGTILDQQGIAVRTGHHCAQPVMQRFRVPATVRASLGCYNTMEELDALARGLKKVIEVFK